MRPRWLGGPRCQAGDLLGVLAPGATAPRFYSLASSARDGFVEICVRKVPGGVCSPWLDALQPGDRLRAFTRRNQVFPAAPEPVVMISAGCGIGPMAGLLLGAAPGAERTLYFGLRDPSSDFLYDRGHVQHRLREYAGCASRSPAAPGCWPPRACRSPC